MGVNNKKHSSILYLSIISVYSKSKLYNLELMNKNNQINSIKGEQMTIGFGSAKRSYVMCPYTLVKDSDSGYETSNVEKI